MGLCQLTGSAGAGIGMTITIGYNAGQLNFGSYVGFGFGASLRWQPEDSGCQHMEGAFPETRLSASLPLWGPMAIPLSSTYNNYDGNKVNIGLAGGLGPFRTGWNQLNNANGYMGGYMGWGGGGFAGAGVHSYVSW